MSKYKAFSRPYFSVFGWNTDIYTASLVNEEKHGPKNSYTFQAVQNTMLRRFKFFEGYSRKERELKILPLVKMAILSFTINKYFFYKQPEFSVKPLVAKGNP